MLANGGWDLTLILLAWTIWRAPTNASKWWMGFNSAFKDLMTLSHNFSIKQVMFYFCLLYFLSVYFQTISDKQHTMISTFPWWVLSYLPPVRGQLQINKSTNRKIIIIKISYQNIYWQSEGWSRQYTTNDTPGFPPLIQSKVSINLPNDLLHIPMFLGDSLKPESSQKINYYNQVK